MITLTTITHIVPKLSALIVDMSVKRSTMAN